MKTSTKLYELELGFPILTLELDFFFLRKTKRWQKNYGKCHFFYPKTSKEWYHHIKFQKTKQEVFYKKVVLNNLAIFTEKRLCWSLLFYNKMPAFRLAALFNETLVNIAKFLRTANLKNICELLLLKVFPFMLAWTFSYLGKLHWKWRRYFLKNNTKIPL